jgi:hypothetical protein
LGLEGCVGIVDSSSDLKTSGGEVILGGVDKVVDESLLVGNIVLDELSQVGRSCVSVGLECASKISEEVLELLDVAGSLILKRSDSLLSNCSVVLQDVFEGAVDAGHRSR